MAFIRCPVRGLRITWYEISILGTAVYACAETAKPFVPFIILIPVKLSLYCKIKVYFVERL